MKCFDAPQLVALVALGVVGCGVVKVGNPRVTSADSSGHTQTREVAWGDLPGELAAPYAKMGTALRDASTSIWKEIHDVPPPGRVALGDLDRRLAGYEKHPRLDALCCTKDVDVTYVRLGVAPVDDFFRESMELYAFVVQAKATLALDKSVDGAKALAATLAEIGPAFVERVNRLVGRADQLVANLKTTLVQPKFVAHLDLVAGALKKSASALQDSTALVSKLSTDLRTRTA
jgi:hypothetical protein